MYLEAGQDNLLSETEQSLDGNTTCSLFLFSETEQSLDGNTTCSLFLLRLSLSYNGEASKMHACIPVGAFESYFYIPQCKFSLHNHATISFFLTLPCIHLSVQELYEYVFSTGCIEGSFTLSHHSLDKF